MGPLCVFLWAKGLNAKDIIKKCFLFTVGSVWRVKRFTTGSRNVADVSVMTKRLKRRCGSGWDNSQTLLCCGFRRTGKAMGQVYQCRWRICREINTYFFPGSNITCFTFYIRLWPIYWLTLLRCIMEFEVFMDVVSDVTWYGLVDTYQRFAGICYLHPHCRSYFSTAKMEAAGSFETCKSMYRTSVVTVQKTVILNYPLASVASS
jgi:hypothetical protein